MRKYQARDQVRSLASGAFDMRDRRNKATGQDDDLYRGMGGNAKCAVGVILMRQMRVRELHGRAKKQQQDAHHAGQAGVPSTKTAESGKHPFSS